MSEGRSEDFQKHFVELTFQPCALLLFEFGPQTSTEVLDHTIYGEKFLGKTSVVIRILCFHWKPCWYLRIQSLFHLVKRNGSDY
jgi:hypothetical protein